MITAGILIWRNYKYHLVHNKLTDLVTNKSKGLYQLHYRNLVIDEVAGNISAENISILPDTNIYRQLTEKHEEPANFISIRVPRLEISGVKTPKILLEKEITGHLIRISNAVIEIQTGKPKKGTKIDLKKDLASDVYEQVLGNLKSIKADSILLDNITLTVLNKETKIIQYRAIGLSLHFIEPAIDSNAALDSGRIVFSRDMSIHFDSLYLHPHNRIYHTILTGFNFDSHEASMHLDEFRFSPKLSESAFAASYKVAKDRFNFTIKKLDLIHIDRQSLIGRNIVADELKIAHAVFLVYRDKSVPHDSVDRTNNYPHQVIMKLPFKVNIRKMILSDAYIEYKEKNGKSDSSGKVEFFNVDAQLRNITNIPTAIRRDNKMILDFKSSFLHLTPFQTHITMLLNDPQGRFYLDAHLGSFDATGLNQLLRPMALAEIKKGHVDSLQFHLNATNHKSNGTIKFAYHDLNIKLLKKDDDANKYKNKVIPSLLASVVLRKSNPSNGDFKTVNADYERDIYRSMFNMMWKSLFTAIKKVAK